MTMSHIQKHICPEGAEGCEKTFIKMHYRQKTCPNPACMSQRKRRTCQRWHQRNRQKRRQYMAEYRRL